jgi:hypothetical protein
MGYKLKYVYIGKIEILIIGLTNMAQNSDSDSGGEWVPISRDVNSDNDTDSEVELVAVVNSGDNDTDSGNNNVGGLKADIQKLKSTNHTVNSILCQPSQNDDPKCVEINLFKDNHKVADLKFQIEPLQTTYGKTKNTQEYITITVNAVVEDDAGIIKCIRHYVTLLSGNNQLFKATVADQ